MVEEVLPCAQNSIYGPAVTTRSDNDVEEEEEEEDDDDDNDDDIQMESWISARKIRVTESGVNVLSVSVSLSGSAATLYTQQAVSAEEAQQHAKPGATTLLMMSELGSQRPVFPSQAQSEYPPLPSSALSPSSSISSLPIAW